MSAPLPGFKPSYTEEVILNKYAEETVQDCNKKIGCEKSSSLYRYDRGITTLPLYSLQQKAVRAVTDNFIEEEVYFKTRECEIEEHTFISSICFKSCSSVDLSFEIQSPEELELKEKLKDVLVKLKSAKFFPVEERTKTIRLAQSVWSLIYKIGIKKIKFTSEEKSKLGPLIESALLALTIEINFRIGDFEPAISKETLVVRSALQFLLDDYQDFPVPGDSLLGESLSDLKELAEDLTEVLEDWKNSPADFLDYTGPVPEGVSESHHWWF